MYPPNKLWTQPVITDNGTIGGDRFALSTTIPLDPAWLYTSNIWRISDGIIATSPTGTGQMTNVGYSGVSAFYGEVLIYNPEPLCIKKITVYDQPNYGSRKCMNYTISVSDDNISYTEILRTIAGRTQPWVIDLSSNTGYYQYYKWEAIDTWPDNTSFGTYWNINEVQIKAYIR